MWSRYKTQHSVAEMERWNESQGGVGTNQLMSEGGGGGRGGRLELGEGEGKGLVRGGQGRGGWGGAR